MATYIKLNFNGEYKGNPRSMRYGGFFRGSVGKTLNIYASYIGSNSNNVVELSALLVGLKIARGHQLHHLQVQRDWKMVINIVKCLE